MKKNLVLPGNHTDSNYDCVLAKSHHLIYLL